MIALAGRAGARLTAVLHIPVSRTTLLNVMPDPPRPALRVLGVDDFATRRGRRYGTVLVDLDSHRVVDLLPGREKAPLVAWLSGHPGIEMICRDRAGAYAEAAGVGAPQARQVADAWHLWDNLAHAVQRTVIAHRSCLTPSPAKHAEPMPESAPDPALNPDTGTGTGTEKWLVTRTRERHQAVQDLLARGWTISAIGRELGLARHTARRYARCENPEALADRAIRTTRLDAWRPTWSAAGTRAARTPPHSSGKSRPRAIQAAHHKPSAASCAHCVIHPFGTDALGRDILARIAHGALNTLGIALAVSALALVTGILLGLLPRLSAPIVDTVNALPPVLVGSSSPGSRAAARRHPRWPWPSSPGPPWPPTPPPCSSRSAPPPTWRPPARWSPGPGTCCGACSCPPSCRPSPATPCSGYPASPWPWPPSASSASAPSPPPRSGVC